MFIKRRTKRKHKGLFGKLGIVSERYVETKEPATLVKRGKKTSWVRLSNGSVIKRRNRDIITP